MSKAIIDFKWIEKAVETIESGLTNKIVSTDKRVQVYKCGSVIRIDIKED